jgi:hypothetical protein
MRIRPCPEAKICCAKSIVAKGLQRDILFTNGGCRKGFRKDAFDTRGKLVGGWRLTAPK